MSAPCLSRSACAARLTATPRHCATPGPQRLLVQQAPLHAVGTPARQTQARSSADGATASSGGGSSKLSISHGTGRYLFLGALFATWYAFNIMFNIYNKQVLQVFKFPLTITTYQFFLGSVISLMWFVATGTRPNINKSTVKSIVPLAIIHTLGNTLTNLSLGFVAVSFTHTIKASEPLFSVLLTSIFLKESVDPYVLLSLVPIIGGVIGASLSEVTFNWPGFLSALGSNITFQSRNVLSKKMMTPDLKEQTGGSIGLFSMITIVSFFILAPIALLVEGFKLSTGAMTAMGISNAPVVLQRATGAALTFHLYQQVSYMILSRVNPVSHAIGNCVKRVVVIVSAVIFFGNPMSLQSKISTSVALAGVFAYSQVKRLRKSKES